MSAQRVLNVLGWAAAALLVAVGVLELLLDHEEGYGPRLVFLLVLTVLALAIRFGISLMERSPWPGAAVASAAAVIGGFMLFWTVLAVLLAAGIVVFGLVVARRAEQGTG